MIQLALHLPPLLLLLVQSPLVGGRRGGRLLRMLKPRGKEDYVLSCV